MYLEKTKIDKNIKIKDSWPLDWYDSLKIKRSKKREIATRRYGEAEDWVRATEQGAYCQLTSIALKVTEEIPESHYM